jgi:hypothetical protein
MSDEPVDARPLYKVKLVVRHKAGSATIGGYTRELDMPCPPCLGLRLKQGISTRLWETEIGDLDPVVEEIIYDIDEETMVCLFTVHKALISSFWKRLRPNDLTGRSDELRYFQD